MEDVLYQWNRVVIDHHNMSEGIESKPLSVKNWSLLAYMNKDQESSYSK
jgi:hypothetical protein